MSDYHGVDFTFQKRSLSGKLLGKRIFCAILHRSLSLLMCSRFKCDVPDRMFRQPRPAVLVKKRTNPIRILVVSQRAKRYIIRAVAAYTAFSSSSDKQ